MNVVFYRTSDDNRKLDKSLTSLFTANVQIWKDCDILHPVFIIDNNTVVNSNYMYVPKWERYYFVDNITISDGGHYVLRGSVDVLKTYATQIKGVTATITRNSNLFNLYLDDGQFKTLNYPRIQTFKFPRSLSKNLNNFVLTVAGG